MRKQNCWRQWVKFENFSMSFSHFTHHHFRILHFRKFVEWEIEFLNMNVNENWTRFCEIICTTVEKYVPFSSWKRNKSWSGWMEILLGQDIVKWNYGKGIRWANRTLIMLSTEGHKIERWKNIERLCGLVVPDHHCGDDLVSVNGRTSFSLEHPSYTLLFDGYIGCLLWFHFRYFW